MLDVRFIRIGMHYQSVATRTNLYLIVLPVSYLKRFVTIMCSQINGLDRKEEIFKISYLYIRELKNKFAEIT